jgi:hypothetical protein
MPLPFHAGPFYVGPILEKSKDVFDSEIIGFPEIEGVTIRSPWWRLEPTLGIYDWSVFEDVVDLCVAKRKKIALMLLCGEETPDWSKPLIRHSAFTLDRGGGEEKDVLVPHPWDPVYAQLVVALHRALVDFLIRKGALGLLAYVRLAIMGMGGELALARPRGGGDRYDPIILEWQRVGYTKRKVVDGYMNMARPIAAMLSPPVMLVQGILDAPGFPTIGDDGRFYDGKDTTRLEIFRALLADPAVGGRIGVGDQSLMPESARRIEDSQREIMALGIPAFYQENKQSLNKDLSEAAVDPDGTPATPATFAELLRTGWKYGDTIELFGPDIRRFRPVIAQVWAEKRGQSQPLPPPVQPPRPTPTPQPEPDKPRRKRRNRFTDLIDGMKRLLGL